MSELCNTINELVIASTENPIFMMKDLREMYQAKLKELGASQSRIENVNVTRLKESILKEVNGLCEGKNGKYTILTTNGSFGRVVFEASQKSTSDENVIISKAAALIRKTLFSQEHSFDGNFEINIQSLPNHLLELLAQIIDGSKNMDTISQATKDIAVKITQVVKFNAVKTTRRKSETIDRRHSKQNELPLPSLVGLSIHSKTRKRGIVEFLFLQGFSISYDRVIEIVNHITKQLCLKYNKDGLVCPPSLRKLLFTIAAIDNLDHDPSSTTAKKSFHGTSISIFQYPEEGEESPKFVMEKDLSSEEDVQLPSSYTCVLPAKDYKPEPTNRSSYQQDPFFNQQTTSVEKWQDDINSSNLSDGERINFASYFSARTSKKMPRTSSTLLPLLEESVNSTAMVQHCMNLIKKLTNHLNPGQVTVITADQPVYAIGKQVEWTYPDKFCDVLWMLGPLHIEMMFMSAIGDWLEGNV